MAARVNESRAGLWRAEGCLGLRDRRSQTLVRGDGRGKLPRRRLALDGRDEHEGGAIEQVPGHHGQDEGDEPASCEIRKSMRRAFPRQQIAADEAERRHAGPAEKIDPDRSEPGERVAMHDGTVDRTRVDMHVHHEEDAEDPADADGLGFRGSAGDHPSHIRLQVPGSRRIGFPPEPGGTSDVPTCCHGQLRRSRSGLVKPDHPGRPGIVSRKTRGDPPTPAGAIS